jgi:hypothetical protein
MESKTEFVALMVVELNVKQSSDQPQLRFINRNHIMQVWQEGNDIILELSDYGKLKICNQNIQLLMDRFV